MYIYIYIYGSIPLLWAEGMATKTTLVDKDTDMNTDTDTDMDRDTDTDTVLRYISCSSEWNLARTGSQ